MHIDLCRADAALSVAEIRREVLGLLVALHERIVDGVSAAQPVAARLAYPHQHTGIGHGAGGWIDARE